EGHPPEDIMTTLSRSTTRLRRRQAMELLTRGLPPADVASQLGVSLRTVRRYLEDGELLAELRRAHSERIEALLRASLQTVASDENAPQWTCISAARAVIYQTLRLYETADLARRVEHLEQTADANSP
ncbi:MAG: helix-turn-helix domain-containing protein, partial [Dehalococcoidia bacterium]